MRRSGFFKLSLNERRRAVAEATRIDLGELTEISDSGGLDVATSDRTIENVLGVYTLPFAAALNFRINGRDVVAPMVTEEPSVVAAASNAARLVREGGGFEAEADAPVVSAQVQITGVLDAEAARGRIMAAQAEILSLADAAAPRLAARGGGARSVRVRVLGTEADRMIVVDVAIDCRDAMGANLVNGVAEAIGDRVAELASGQPGFRVLSNLCDQRRVRVRCRVPCAALATAAMTGGEVARRIVDGSRFAELDPYRAATHNKGIMNGVDAVVLATGNDFRAVEAGAHAYAALDGRYQPLSAWRVEGDVLTGRLELPLALSTVGRMLAAHPAARLALRISGASSSSELAMLAASVGLATNLAALKALASEGIQRGHMALHARAQLQPQPGAPRSSLQRVTVELEYPVHHTEDVFDPANATLADAITRKEPGRAHRLLLVLDRGVVDATAGLAERAAAYVERHAPRLRLAAPPLIVAGGEACKNDPAVAEALVKSLHELAIDRHSFVLAVGGGAVLDMAGYAAAITHRGVRLVRMPTTVLAQADSGVGVKNGINAFGKKNFLGTFVAPFAVISDSRFLSTLEPRDRVSGMAEAVKVALIRDRDFFGWIREHAAALREGDRELLATLVRRSAELHLQHIATSGDPFELGSARPLDFGHWAAHKLESMTQHRLRHGEAVAIGLALDSLYSAAIGRCDAATSERVIDTLERLGLTLWDEALERCDAAGRPRVLDGAAEFREHLGGELTVTLLEELGVGVEVHELDERVMCASMARLRARSGPAALKPATVGAIAG